MDGARPQSLFVVVSYKCDAPYFCSILQLDTKVNYNQFLSLGGPREMSSFTSPLEARVVESQVLKYDYVAHFQHPPAFPPIIYVFSHLPSFPEDLCMMPYWGPRNYQMRAPLQGCIFNFRTKKCKSIKPPGGSSQFKHVVDLGEQIYFMGAPDGNSCEPGAFFARHNLREDSWETLSPFPYDNIKRQGDRPLGSIVATAVWKNTILLTMDGCGMWAYDVATNKWYPVVNDDKWCDKIAGKAVVLYDTIYSLLKREPLYGEIVVALSINKKKEVTKDGFVFMCSLHSEILVPGLDEVEYDDELAWWTTRDLVHLGLDNFCIVRSCNSHLYNDIGYQPIQVNNMKLNRENMVMTVTDICVHEIKLVNNEQFDVQVCFSLPEDMTTAFKLGNRSIFNFDPFPENYPSKPFLCYKGYPSLNAQITSKLDNDSSQIILSGVRNSIKLGVLPPGATVRELEKRLRKFGPIKKDGIHVRRNKNGMLYAIVDFETVASKQAAIEASTITIGPNQVRISNYIIVWSKLSYVPDSSPQKPCPGALMKKKTRKGVNQKKGNTRSFG